ncbi:D-alanyl-D-alanine carboxypeptidase family protein [Streptomyces sp. NBC_00539]|uniref:D-alanyl-D-alanine carboxypeptidase family protein n=1 Tax=Streptomyces sp. NBC_00539 TaxID=2975770 RepID=UPI002E80928D|nr:hypothetical protein [Streptomyces sp. NBC_00539]WUC66035.1 hypothetical protein OG861_18295 [Streptomyces sp. NBC_00539]
MAGESPDKSVDEGASGTAEPATPRAERDPRLSVLRPREAVEPGDRDPLKEAVAAWVATEPSRGSGDRAPARAEAEAEAEASGADEADSAEPAGPADRRTTTSGAVKPGSSSVEPEEEPRTPTPAKSAAADSEQASASDADGPDPAKPSGSGEAEKTASGAAKPGSGKPEDKPAAAEPADSERTAVFRAVKPEAAGSGSAGRDSAKASGSDASEKTAFGVAKSGSGKPEDKPADSERTAVFRAVKPEVAGSGSAGRDSAKPAGSGEAEKTASGSGADGASGSAAAEKKTADEARTAAPAKPAAAGPADSERTAVFRAVKPEAAGSGSAGRDSAKASGSGEAEKTAFGVAKPGSGKPEDKPADSERTAVFRAVKPEAAGSGSAGRDSAKASGSDASEKTASGAAKPRAEKPGDTGTGPADSERTAVFRKPGSGDPRTTPAKPAPAKPAAAEPADSERTAVFRAVKPGTAAPTAEGRDAAKPAPGGPAAKPAGANPRGSTFVPLGGDGPRPPAPQTARPPARPQPSPDAERTTQQPLPPKPPLDMLADLTNNPPPPPTPLRTTVRRVKIYAPVVLLLAVVLAVVQLVRPLPAPRLALSAKASYTFDGGAPTLPWPKEGQGFMAAAGLGTVGTFGEQKPIAIGSVAKTMTAYVILKNHPLKPREKGPMIDVDKTAVDDGRKESEGESTVNTLKEGDKISEYDALAAIMIPSANNVARLLARWDTAGDQEAFVKKMNDAARELGMTNTTYTDPSGLDPATVSTAEDQVKLGLKVVEMPELLAITKLPSWTDPSGKPWRNYNDLVPYNGAVGIKTGSTTKAGGNLLFAAEKKVGKTNQLIVGAVLGQYGTPILGTAIAASKDVMLATQKALTDATVVKKGDVVGYVDDGLGGHTPVVATADVQAVGWPSLTVTVKLGDGGSKLPETAKAGTEVGMLTVGEGASQVKVPVALKSDLVAPGIGSKLTRVG